MMKDRNTALFSPEAKALGPKLSGPKLMEAQGGREQNEAVDFRMAGGIEGGQVAAEAGTDDDYSLAAAEAIDQGELFRESQAFEIALSEIGDLDGEAEGREFVREEAGLAGGRAGSKAVQIEDTRALGQYLNILVTLNRP